MTTIQEQIFALQDIEYRNFHTKLIPTVEPDKIIGVRTPQLRKLAREIAKDPEIETFLNTLPHAYYEENNLHGFLIEAMKDYEACVSALDKFLPYVDNWATCDMIRPKTFAKHTQELLVEIERWLNSKDTYTIRFGIEMLMTFYLDKEFNPAYLEKVAAIRSEEYYVNMMIAWYFATALTKQYASAILYIEERRLEEWTHNKAIQKAIESYRIGKEQKDYLRTLKIKKTKE